LIKQLVGQNERMLNTILANKEVLTQGQQPSIGQLEEKLISKNDSTTYGNNFAVGDRVLMHGLVKMRSLNGKFAEIMLPINRRGLHRVKVLETQKVLSIKPKNLRFHYDDGSVAV